MDEILTRWAADLSKYQKEFQKSAKQVGTWDTLLVKNTEKISKLYAKAFQAERDAGEVEKQISAVEAEQDELEQWLSKYEAEVEDMVRKAGVGVDAGPGGGVDLEREKVYRAAERVSERLEGLNRDLGDVIEEVNSVGAVVGRSSGPDDQVSIRFFLWHLANQILTLSLALEHRSRSQLASPAAAGH
jgi:nuclear pore complex protein Nup62